MSDCILRGLSLHDEQRCAALATGDTAVLAGAGCGKTRTLVGRYLYLLATGLAPDEIVAITFTERAGREMRSRIRACLRSYLTATAVDRELWLERYIALDGAPIGTIHGYCAQLLRAHPAEAGLDPDFAVLEEGQARLLAGEAVERALVWATHEATAIPCFDLFGGPAGLRALLSKLLDRRLDVAPAFAQEPAAVLERWRAAPAEWLAAVLADPAWRACLAELEAAQSLEAGDRLDELRQQAIDAVAAARRQVAAGDWEAAVRSLAEGLHKPGGAGSRRAWGELVAEVRAALRTLCDLYEAQVRRVTDKADLALDEALAAAWPGLVATFHQAASDYQALKAQRRAVDFDDLEVGALRLLEEHPEVAAGYRQRCKAVLLDEFQDTNERQRQIVEALLGAPAGQAGRLFVVGDAKQSIYRFRGADVTVFRRLEGDIERAGGRVVRLARTYRAHAPLVGLLNELLAAVLGADDDPARPHMVPFAPLVAADDARIPRLQAPFLELHLGVGANAEEGRQAAAAALARRLVRLHEEEGLAWREVACLFRATTNFALYEEAFERAGIPYVTVAGSGFYERPEVRDLLNALRALAQPTDDLAMAGLLRSPAIGLADASLYRLRRGPRDELRPLWAALQGDLEELADDERQRARRAVALIQALHPQVGRLPVAMVLKRFLDLTAYKAILRLVAGGERAGRNVDKLLADAHRSEAVGVGDFLDYVGALRGVGAREGEAPPEVGEAVQLMSVHRAKGLEFPLVVIADAGHSDAARVPDLLIHPAWGPLVRVSRSEGSQRWEGLLHALGRRQEEEMQDAEERRLLYVAATRAEEKLLVSGHLTKRRHGLAWQGWLRRLAAALGEDVLATAPLPEPGRPSTLSCWQGRVLYALYAVEEEGTADEGSAPAAPEPGGAATGEPLTLARPYVPSPASPRRKETETPSRVWRVVPRSRGQRAPAWLVGKLVHVGLRLWAIPGSPELDEALRTAARGAGLTDEGRIAGAVGQARRLLERFRGSELYRQLEAGERRHEVPYAADPGDAWGRIDLLSRRPDGSWWLVDFKTDELRGMAQWQAKVAEHSPQVRRYGRAAARFLGQMPRLLLCFLDCEGTVRVQEVPPEEET